jgi:hypothetical protein
MQRPRTRGATAAGEMKRRAMQQSPRCQTVMMACIGGPSRWAPGAGGPLRIRAPPHNAANCAAPGTSIALTLRGPAPGGALNTLSLVAAATLAPRPARSIDRVLREVEAALGPLLPTRMIRGHRRWPLL